MFILKNYITKVTSVLYTLLYSGN